VTVLPTYRFIQEAIAPELPRDAASLSRAHLPLRQHGKTLCRNNNPQCEVCPVAALCAFAGRRL
jgi:endonuclease III